MGSLPYRGLCGDLSPHRTTMTQTKCCSFLHFGLWWWCVKKVMNKAIVRDLGHFDNAIDLACLDCLEGMLQMWPLRPSCLRSESRFLQRVISTSSITLVHMKKMMNKAIVGNTEHFHKEFDLVGSEVLEGINVGQIKPLPVSHGVIMPASCRQSSKGQWRRCTFMHSLRNSPSLPRNIITGSDCVSFTSRNMSRTNFLFHRGTRLSMQSHRL